MSEYSPITSSGNSSAPCSPYDTRSSSPLSYDNMARSHNSFTTNQRIQIQLRQIMTIFIKLIKVSIFHPIRFIRTTLLGKIVVFLSLAYALLSTSVSYYEINTAEVHDQLSSAIQGFYQSATGSGSKYLYNSYDFTEDKAIKRPFDSDAALRNLLRDPESYVFQWRDWVDLTHVEPLVDSIETVRQSSYAWLFPWTAQLSGISFSKPSRQRSVELQQARIGDAYLDLYGTIPNKVILVNSNMTDRSNNSIFYVASNRTESARSNPPVMDQSGNKAPMVDRQDDIVAYDKVVKKFGEVATGRKLFDIIESSPDLQPLPQALLPPVDRQFLNLTQDDFIFDIDKVINFTGIADQGQLTDEAKINSVRTEEHLKEASEAPKFFYEAVLRNDRTGHGGHYDWRFFKHVRKNSDKRDTIHHLVRTWLQFTENEGIVSWLSHGTLLGWYWNGLTMPWDTDGDIQMPIKELDRFARRYNNTLIVQDPVDGDGRYYIEVGPWYAHRSRGNGNNVIDARFIDTRSGMYLDITGLAYPETPKGEVLKFLYNPEQKNPQSTDSKQRSRSKSKWTGLPRFQCKNNHRYNLDHISPLRRTLFEGVPAYIPNAYTELLKREYPRGMTNDKFLSYQFVPTLQDWVTDDRCKELLVGLYEETNKSNFTKREIEGKYSQVKIARTVPIEKDKETLEREKKEKEEREKKEKEEREKKTKEEREKKEKEEREKKEKEEREKKEKQEREKKEKEEREKKETLEREKKAKEEREKKAKEEREKKEQEERERKKKEEKRNAILKEIMEKSYDKDTGKLNLLGACGDEEFLEFYSQHSLPFTNLHQREMEAIKNGESTWDLIKESFPLIRPNPRP